MPIPVDPPPEEPVEFELPENVQFVVVNRMPAWRGVYVPLQGGDLWYDQNHYLDVCGLQRHAIDMLAFFLDPEGVDEEPLFLDAVAFKPAKLLADPRTTEGCRIYQMLASHSDPRLAAMTPNCFMFTLRRRPHKWHMLIPIFDPQAVAMSVLIQPGLAQ